MNCLPLNVSPNMVVQPTNVSLWKWHAPVLARPNSMQSAGKNDLVLIGKAAISTPDVMIMGRL